MSDNICWHGTNEAAAMKILKEGFEPYTHFAAHIEDALAFGGPFVFDVIFDEPAPHWQFRPSERIGPERIRTLTQFWSKTISGSTSFQRTEMTELERDKSLRARVTKLDAEAECTRLRATLNEIAENSHDEQACDCARQALKGRAA